MGDQIRKAESELRAFHTLWWFFLSGTGVYALLIYIMSGSGTTSGWTGQISGAQVLFTLLLVGVSFLDFVLSMWFPSERRIRNLLSRQYVPRSSLSTTKTRGKVSQHTLFGSLILGTVFGEGIAIYGLLLAFLGISGDSGVLVTYGYLLILFGAIVLVLQRWRATRLVKSILKEMRTKSGKRTWE